MQINPLSNVNGDLLGSLTVSTNGWVNYAISDLSKYNFISIMVSTTDQGSYPIFMAMDDFVNISTGNALVAYGTSNADRIMFAYDSLTTIGIYNTHTPCTAVVRGFM